MIRPSLTFISVSLILILSGCSSVPIINDLSVKGGHENSYTYQMIDGYEEISKELRDEIAFILEEADRSIDQILAAGDKNLEGRGAGLVEFLLDRLNDPGLTAAFGTSERVVEEATDRFLALGDDATFDDWFQIADEYNGVPYFAEALEKDRDANKNPKDDDSAIMKVVKFFQGR